MGLELRSGFKSAFKGVQVGQSRKTAEKPWLPFTHVAGEGRES